MNPRHSRLLGALFVSLLAACATPVSTNIQPSETSVAKYRDMSDLNVVAALERSVNEAKAANMPFLAPNYYKEAAQILSECQNQLGGKQHDQLVAKAAKGDAILEKGRAVMDVVKYRFTRELELKDQLDTHNSSTLLPKDYEQVVGRLSGLIEKVEREQAGSIDKDKEQVQKALLDLLIRTVQQGALQETESINAESKKNHAEQQAPLTFAEAQKVYQEARSQIAANHHDEKLVQSWGTKALFAAKHARQINDRVTLLQAQLNVSSGGGAGVGIAAGGAVGGAQVGMSSGGRTAAPERASLEKIVLQEEERLHGIATALGLEDLRDRPLDKQAEEIRRAAADSASKSRGDETIRELKAKLKAAEDTAQQSSAQLAEKDAEIRRLHDKLEQSAKVVLPKTAKPRAARQQPQ